MQMTRALGFSLIELMIVVAMIGVLVVVALPTYWEMTIRARVAEGIEAAKPAKAALAERYQVLKTLPASDENILTGGTGAVRRVNWSVGRNAIEVWFGANAGPALTGRILWLHPTPLPNGSIRWVCAGHSGQGGAGWELPNRYLPSSCRN